MKKIGFLVGADGEMINALIERINSLNIKGVKAELATIGGVKINEKPEYSVIFDNVSHDVPFYNSYLRNVAEKGTKVVNLTAKQFIEDYFMYHAICESLKIKTPRTIALPSKQHPAGINSDYMYNLAYPLPWNEIFEYTGFPACIKPNRYNLFYKPHIIYNTNEFFSIYDLTGSELMLLQEYIDYDCYCRVYSIGDKQRIIKYDPHQALKTKFCDGEADVPPALAKKIKANALKFNKKTNIDFNAIEVAVKDGEPYFTEFINLDPYTSSNIIKKDNFNWVLDSLADMLISMCEEESFTQIPEKRIKKIDK
jgi:hypothetical protein